MDASKRKRDDEGTVVTFYTSDRTFQRVYKGQSLEETKTLVRTKLGLSEDASIRFSRLHEGRHIDLEDDDDFEAFRHLARYVTTLDVSVFVGNGEPPIFSQQPLAEPVSTSRKRQKAVGQRLSIAHSEPTSGRSTPSSATAPRPPTSTLDAHGVPQNKRKRREEPQSHNKEASDAQSRLVSDTWTSRPAQSIQQGPEAGPSKPSKKNSGKHRFPAPVLGSKRKRHDSPEASAAPNDRPTTPPPPTLPLASRPASPSYPTRKKQKKEKRSLPADEATNATDDSSAPGFKPDRKGKRKADAAAEPSQSISRTIEANETHGGETADTEDNVLTDKPAKKAKGEKKDKKRKVVAEETPSTDLEEASAPSEESSKKKRKRRVTEGPTDLAVVPAAAVEVIDATVIQPEASNVTSGTDVPALKKDKKKSKKGKEEQRVAESADLEVEDGSSPDAAATVEPAPSVVAKRKRTSKNKTLKSTNDALEDSGTTLPIEAPEPDPSSVPEAVAEVQQKEKRKRRKTVSADTSVDPDVSTVSSAAVLEADVSQTAEAASPAVQSASTAKKRGRKNSIAHSPSQAAENSDSASAIAAVQAAVKAVLAKNMLAAAPPAPIPAPPEPTPAPAPERVLPARKRKAGKSKLRQAWGPEDISVDDQSSVSVTVVQETGVSPAQSASALSPAKPIQVVSKAAKGKARPSSAPSCPICDKASLHSRTQCPVVKGGPEFIRKRIAQLQQEGHDDELIDELEVLLKEAQRRRKSVGDRLAPHQIPSVATTTSEESTPSPVFPLSAASFATRPSPLPRVPAGSEISEVAIESKDEGSSNESSSSDEDEDAMDSEAPKTASVSFASNSVLGADLGSIDLDALLRGPVKSNASVLSQIPSSSTTEDDGGSSDEDARQDSDVDLSEEDKNDLAYRRLSRKLERAAVSSSDEEHEPDAEAGDADADTEDAVVPPTFMDMGPNSAADAQPEQEAAANGDDTEDASVQDEQEEQPASPESKDATDQGYESDAKDVAAPQSPAREAEVLDQNSEESESETEEPATHRGDGSRVEPTADVDESGPPSQEPPVQSDEEAEAPVLETGPAADDEASDDEDIQVVAVGEANKHADEPAPDDSASEDDEEVEQTTALTALAARALSPELGEQQPSADREVEQEPERNPSPPPLQLPEFGFVHADVDMPADTSAHASSIDLHPGEDPSDPIESLGSFADVSERRRALDDDPIEDTDAENEAVQLQHTATRASAELAGLQEGTPPPAVHRTPGTVSRMKDRYGRLGHGSPSTMLPSLSQQLLGSLELPQPGVDAEMDAEDDEEDATPKQEDGPQQEEEDEAPPQDNDDAPRAPSQQTQDEEADEPQELETGPRRTTRVTRRASAMTRSSSVPEPPASTPTPAPAPPSTAPAAVAAPKRRGRLTAEEKAAREAEKKAERDRKAAEKKAEREAKAAEKKAEKEAKEAAKRAEKEAKEAAKLAAKEGKEAPKRGKGRATRGKAASAKPVSTRLRAAASVETEEPAEDEHAQKQDHDASGEPSTAAAASTPGFSKVSWTTLPATQPRTQTESVADAESSMLDELQPSSPERSVSRRSRSPEPISRTTNTTEKEEADVSREVTITQDRVIEEEEDNGMPTATPKPHGRGKEPLFIPSSSQFPNTPFPENGLPESTPYANGRALGDVSESDAEADGEPADIEGTVRKQAKGRPRAWLTTAPYRRLSDIASQQLFPASQIPSPMLFPASQSQPRKSSAAYGRREDDGDDDDDDETDDGSSSGSDSDAGKKKKSHIPQERRAGAGVQKKKKSLLSFA